MSGAAGLAAAKRRRGLPQGPEIPLQQSHNSGGPQAQRIHPMQIMENHERRIRTVEEFARKSEGNSNLSEIVTRIEAVEQRNVSNSPVDISKLEEQINTLEAQLNTTTQLLYKLQAFAIEINTSVMKISKPDEEEREREREREREGEEGEGNTDEAINNSESS